MVHPKCIELKEYWYVRRGWEHAYRHLQRAVNEHLDENKSVLDLGCGRTFPLAVELLARTRSVYGVDPTVEPSQVVSGAVVKRGFGEGLPFPACSFDVVTCRSVMEHVERPLPLLLEVARVLKPGASFIFLTPSRYDYVSLAAMALPNSWHPWLIRRLEGRPEEDTFPTRYRANSKQSVWRLADQAGLVVDRLVYLNHHPSYFMFSPLLYRLATLYDRLVCRFSLLAPLRGWLLGVLRKPVGEVASERSRL